MGLYLRGSLEERFLQKVQKEEAGCWHWIGSVDSRGYGNIGVKTVKGFLTQRAHRVAYTLFVGPIPKGKVVCHTCDNRCCVNPEHLFLGSQKDNVKDCVEKGRFGDRRGCRNPKAKLSEDQVLLIRASTASANHLAAELGISSSTIYSIRTGESWSHL